MTEMMRCLVKDKSEVGLWMQKRPIPKIGPEDVLIRVSKTGICGTDIHIWNWDDWSRRACLLYTSPSPRDQEASRMPSSA